MVADEYLVILWERGGYLMREHGRWAYYMLMRPYGPGAAPRGVVDWWEMDGETVIPEIGHHAWAVIVYDHPLTAKEIKDYELAEVS